MRSFIFNFAVRLVAIGCICCGIRPERELQRRRKKPQTLGKSSAALQVAGNAAFLKQQHRSLQFCAAGFLRAHPGRCLEHTTVSELLDWHGRQAEQYSADVQRIAQSN